MFGFPILLFACGMFIIVCICVLALLAQIQIHQEDKKIVRDIVRENRQKRQKEEKK